MRRGNFSNAIKRMLTRVKCHVKLKFSQFKLAAQGRQEIKSEATMRNDQSGGFPFTGQKALQAAKYQIEPGHKEGNQVESLPRFNPVRYTQGGHDFMRENPGPPDGYITDRDGSQIPFWWNPPGINVGDNIMGGTAR